MTDYARRLQQAAWLNAAPTQRLFDILDGAGQRTRAVGGVVRDTILGRLRPETDVDFATELLPDDIMARADAAGVAHYPTGIEHGTITLKIDDQTFEVTTLREDIETDGRHAVVQFGTNWHHDAARRDFTFNALYAGMDGKLFDPLDGIDDCLAGRARFIGDPDQRIAEDKLRVYRFFRFSASHGNQQCDPDGLAACRRAAGDLSGISSERIGVEMMRMLGLEQVTGVLSAMAEAGILPIVQSILPHLTHYEAITTTPLATGRLAIILQNSHTEDLQKIWRLSNADLKTAQALRQAAALLERGQLNEVAYRFPALTASAPPLAAALFIWDKMRAEQTSAKLAAINPPPFPVGGNDLRQLGMAPGPAFGGALATLERAWIDSDFQLDREALLKRLGTQ